jgi:hypothetical protein
MSVMRLSILSFHVSQIMTADGEFTLHPCSDVSAKIKIEKNPLPEFADKIWDHVYVNDYPVGNRHGGVEKFLELVFKAKPEIEYT